MMPNQTTYQARSTIVTSISVAKKILRYNRRNKPVTWRVVRQRTRRLMVDYITVCFGIQLSSFSRFCCKSQVLVRVEMCGIVLYAEIFEAILLW